VLIALLLVASAAAPLAQRSSSPPAPRDLVGRDVEARIVRIADGDTLDAIIAGQSARIRLRLYGVDAPELGEPFARDAQAHVSAMINAQRVRVTGRDIDNYGRLVAHVSISGKDVGAALIRAGLACHAYARDAALAREEAQARAAGSGFWARGAQKPRCAERTAFSARDRATTLRAAPRKTDRSTASPATVAFRGNVATGVYHASTCPNFTCRNCTRVFGTEAEAKAAGFRPAGDCARKP
jgi:micrococcal nuclease